MGGWSLVPGGMALCKGGKGTRWSSLSHSLHSPSAHIYQARGFLDGAAASCRACWLLALGARAHHRHGIISGVMALRWRMRKGCGMCMRGPAPLPAQALHGAAACRAQNPCLPAAHSWLPMLCIHPSMHPLWHVLMVSQASAHHQSAPGCMHVTPYRTLPYDV